MNSIKRIYTNPRVITALMILSIILMDFLTYRDIFNYFFKADEEIACIEAGRFQSGRDIINIFTRAYLEGAGWPGNFYRPIAELSCGLNYLIWKLNPVPYYLTNLVIHILVSVVVFFLARRLTGGKQFIAWLSAILFTIHPVHLDTISLVTMIGDFMGTLFLLLSFFLFLGHISTVSHKRLFLFSSIFFYVLAFGSKEITIILPFLIFTYLVIFSDEASSKVRIVHAIKKTAPYFIVTFVLIAWRAYILEGSKGISGNYPIWNIIFNYFYSLIDPDNFLLLLTSPKRKIFVLLMLIVFGFLLFYKEVISKGKLLLIGKRKNQFFPISYKGKLVTFLLIWYTLPLSIYCLWMILPLPWRMYPPLVPFCILISFLFIESLKTIKGSARLLLFKKISISIIIGILILFLFYTSPLRKFHERNPDIKSASMFLDKLREVVPKLPDDANVHVYNVPENIFPFGVPIELLNLVYPSNNVKAIFSYTIPPVKPLPDKIDFEIQTMENNDTNINVILKTKDGKIIQ